MQHSPLNISHFLYYTLNLSLSLEAAYLSLCKNEGNTHCSSVLHSSCGSPCQITGLNGGNLQPGTTECLRECNHDFKSADSALLHQDQGTEAMPLPVPQEPQSQEVCGLTKCKKSCQHLQNSFPQMLRNSAATKLQPLKRLFSVCSALLWIMLLGIVSWIRD